MKVLKNIMLGVFYVISTLFMLGIGAILLLKDAQMVWSLFDWFLGWFG